MSFAVVVPARLGSTRLPRKMLRDLAGKPLIQWTWEAASRSEAAQVIIATDSEEVRYACQAFGARVVVTSELHLSGTDRVAEVAKLEKWPDDRIVVNVQGDEPLMPPRFVNHVAKLLETDKTADIATLAQPLRDAAEWTDPACVKVVCAGNGRALYFSRAPIPWQRDRTPGEDRLPSQLALRHIGLYAYRVGALKRFSGLPVASLEACESLEQLRALVNGLDIIVSVVDGGAPRGVDTEADFAVVREMLSAAHAP